MVSGQHVSVFEFAVTSRQFAGKLAVLSWQLLESFQFSVDSLQYYFANCKPLTAN